VEEQWTLPKGGRSGIYMGFLNVPSNTETGFQDAVQLWKGNSPIWQDTSCRPARQKVCEQLLENDGSIAVAVACSLRSASNDRHTISLGSVCII